MLSKYFPFTFIGILTLLFFSIPVSALEIPENETILIFADRIEFDQKSERIQGKGNIRVHYKNTRFTSHEIDFLVPEKTLRASGNIHLSADSRYRVQGDSLQLNTRSRFWNIQNPHVFLAPSYYFIADQAEQISKTKIVIFHASYTACDPLDPAWKISCSRGTLDLEGSARLKNITFRLKNKPIFFFPYLRFPLHQEKAPGFLTPDFGRSSGLGIYIENTLYWPIREWTDLTFPLDYYEKRGIGAGFESRYALTKNDFGFLRAYGLNDRQKNETRGDFSLQVQQTLPLKARGIANLTILSDNEYYRDFQQEISKRYSNLLESKAFIEKITDPWNGRILMDFVKSLKDDRTIHYHKAPEITLYTKLRPYRGLPLFFRWNSSWANVRIDDPAQGTFEYRRIDFFPQLFYSLPGQFFTLTSSVSHRKTYYYRQEMRQTPDRNVYGGSFDLTGPKFHRFFGEKWKHIWYPQVSFIYETLDQEKELTGIDSGIDSLDRLRQGRNICISLINRVWQKKSAEKRMRDCEWLNLIIRQRYSFKKDYSSCQEMQTLPGFTDFEIEASSKLRNGDHYTLTYIHDSDRGQMKLADFRCSIRPGSNVLCDLGWRCSRFCETGRISDTVKEQKMNFLHTSLQAPLYKQWIGKMSLYYDIKNESAVENQYTLIYQGACWSAQLMYTYRFNGQRWNVKINLNSLGGIDF